MRAWVMGGREEEVVSVVAQGAEFGEIERGGQRVRSENNGGNEGGERNGVWKRMDSRREQMYMRADTHTHTLPVFTSYTQSTKSVHEEQSRYRLSGF